MSNLRQAAQQALEALEGEQPGWRTPAQERAINALRSALEQPELTQDSTCNNTLRAQGKAYPRTCKKCGFGPCIADRVQPKQEQAWLTGCPSCGMDYECECCDIAADGVCEALECCKEQSTKCGEPVAWMQKDGEHLSLTQDEWYCIPLYTHPPSQRSENLKSREWRGLTEEDFNSPMFSVTSLGRCDVETIKSICKDAEAALKEKNHE